MTRRSLCVFFTVAAVVAGGARPLRAVEGGQASGGTETVFRLPAHEELTYEIRWLGLRVGTLTASINGIKKINGRDAYEIVVTVKVNDVTFGIFTVDDRYVSYMDAEELYALHQEAFCPAGRYKKDTITDFDQAHHTAYFRDRLKKTIKVTDVPERVQDLVTAVYYLRLLSRGAGTTEEYPLYNDKAVYRVHADVGAKESMTFPSLGVREVFPVHPYTRLKDGSEKKERLWGYFGADEKRRLYRAVIDAPLFTRITVSLVNDAP